MVLVFRNERLDSKLRKSLFISEFNLLKLLVSTAGNAHMNMYEGAVHSHVVDLSLVINKLR